MRNPMPSKTSPSGWMGNGGNLLVRPEVGFAAATFTGFAVWAASSAHLHADLVMPVVATLFFAFAAVFGLTAWLQNRTDFTRVTYADVAGALTLVGICAAATIEPDQLVAIVEGTGTTTADTRNFNR